VRALDLVFIVLLVLFALRGFLKSFSEEFFSITSLALALIAGFVFYKNGAAFLRSLDLPIAVLKSAMVPEIAAFLAVFLIVVAAGKITGNIVKDIIQRLHLDFLDKILGIFLGLAEAFALIVLVLFIIKSQPLFDPVSLLRQSLFARFLLPLLMGSFHV